MFKNLSMGIILQNCNNSRLKRIQFYICAGNNTTYFILFSVILENCVILLVSSQTCFIFPNGFYSFTKTIRLVVTSRSTSASTFLAVVPLSGKPVHYLNYPVIALPFTDAVNDRPFDHPASHPSSLRVNGSDRRHVP